MRIYPIILGLICLCVGGCTTAQQQPPLTADQVVQIDLSSTAQTATLLLQARPNGQQQLVSFYQVQIDNLDPFLVFKESNTAIRLDAGTRQLTIQAVQGRNKIKAAGDFFGEPSRRSLHLKPDQRKVIEYTGPYWMGKTGRIYER